MKKTKILTIVAVAVAIIALLAVLFVLVPKLKDAKDGGVAVKAEETKGVLGEPLDVTLDFYEKWHLAKVSTTTDPYTEGLAKETVLSMALSKKITDNESAYRNEQKDIIICDASVLGDVKAKEIYSNESKAQILIFPKDKDTRGIQVTATLVGEGGYWKITDIACGAGEQNPNVGEFSFDYEGFLLKQSVPAPLNPQFWHLVFSQEDVPGYTSPLILSAESICILEDKTEKVCSDDLLFETKKVRAKGDMTEAGLEVKRSKTDSLFCHSVQIMKSPLIIYWARRDLRLANNPALLQASVDSRERKVPLLPLFILEDYMTEAKPEYQFGFPSRWFLAQAVPKFADKFKNFALVKGKAAQYLIKLAERYELTVFVNEDVYKDFYTQVKKIKKAGINIEVCSDALTIDKETRSGTGTIYSVFTPFKKAVWSSFVKKRVFPVIDLANINYLDKVEVKNLPYQVEIKSEVIWELFSKNRLLLVNEQIINLADLIPEPKLNGWYLTEDEALARFEYFLESDELNNYKNNRDSLEFDAKGDESEGYAYSSKTSKMSLALAWGLVSSRTLVSMMQKHFAEAFDNPFSNRVSEGALTFISELIWREFYRYQMVHRPELMDLEFQKRFQGTINWVGGEEAMKRFLFWIKGETGYPVVDAAMKQIAETGWMHNRSRMIVASILAKNLGVNWRLGQEYFRATLIDLDEASNNGGWQWGASVGADPKPIRIFNPELQAKNYDTSGAYRERWLGESMLRGERIPLVEHKQAREEALVRYGLKGIESRDY
jgi:deoxyribodipyrimidine photo-lyase